MPQENNQLPEQEVQKTVIVHGKTKFGFDQIGNPTPDKWKRISQGLKYLFTGLIAMFTSTTLVNAKQANIISFCLAVGILILGAFDIMLGVSASNGDNSKKGIP